MKNSRISAWLLLLLLFLGAVMLLLRPRGSVAVPLMFAELPASEVPSYFPEHTIAKRHRWVRLNELSTPHLFLHTGKENRLVLNLFPDLEVEVTIVANRNEGETVYGLIDDSPDSLMAMSFHEGIMMGVAVLPDTRQVLFSHVVNDKYVIVEVDPSKVGGCGNCVVSGEHNSGAGQQEQHGVPRLKGTETGVIPSKSSWSRRIAMGDPGKLKETVPGCGDWQPDESTARFRPLLAALGVPPGLLGAANTGKWGFGSTGTSRQQNVGPTSGPITKFQPSGENEYVDVLFIYENDLLAQELAMAVGNNPLANNATALRNMEAKVERMIDLTNGIYIACGIPIELRIAEVPNPGGTAMKLFPGWYRMPAEPQGTNLWNSGYGGPAWNEIQAPVRPNTTPNDPNAHTVWNPVGGQIQAMIGIYTPRYMDLSDMAAPSMNNYFNWIFDRPNNSLLYGDQWWGDALFDAPVAGPSQEPYVNLPEGYVWHLEPLAITVNGQPANPMYDSVAGAATLNLGNPGILTGPIDHPESIHTIFAEPQALNFSHVQPVFRYDQGGISTVYGTDYNGSYTGVLGLRMDLNNTDWNGSTYTGDPQNMSPAGGPLARYPVAHGQQGPFPAVNNVNQGNPWLMDARADIVCVLASDNLAPAGTAGLAAGYENFRQMQLPNKTVGRGPNPIPNRLQESIYDQHEGILQENQGQTYLAYFNGSDLNVTGVSKAFKSGLVAHYPFDGSPEDLSDYRNHGTLYGGSGYMGDANRTGLVLALDGVDGNMTSGDNGDISGLSEISLGAWVKWVNPQAGVIQPIISKGSEFHLRINAVGTLEVELSDSTGPTSLVASNATMNFQAGQWYHVFATYDGTNQNGVRLYVDGFDVNATFSNTPTFSGPLNNDASVLGIGWAVTNTLPNDYLTGSVDNVRIYNVALADWEVQDLYVNERGSSGFDPDNGLVVYYPFTDGSLLDISTQANHANATGAPTTALDRHNGRGNNDSYQLTPGNFINSQNATGFPPHNSVEDFTLSLWLNNSTAAGFCTMASDVNGDNGTVIVANQKYGQFELRVGNNGTLNFHTGPTIQPGTENEPVHASPQFNWRQGRWYHVVLTRVGDRVTFYRDGVRIGSGLDIPGKTSSALPDERTLTFGDSPGKSAVPSGNVNVGQLSGGIDDVRLYNLGLSAANVADLYLLEKPRQQGLLFDPITSLEVHLPISATVHSDTTAQFRDIADPNGLHPFAVGVGINLLPQGRGPGLPGTFDENGSAWLMGTPVPAAGHIAIDPQIPAIGTGNFTWSFWANATAFPTNPNTVTLLGNWENVQDNSFWLDLDHNGLLHFNAQGVGGGTAITPVVSTIPIDNDWTHIVITRDATTAAGGTGTLNIYINGILAGTGSADVDIASPTGPGDDSVWVGFGLKGGAVGDPSFNGSIDEIRYYANRELLDWEVARLFDMESPNTVGSAIIKINFGEDDSTSSDTVQLELFNNNHNIEAPFHDQLYSNSGSSITHSFNAARNGNAWQDMQGCWRITPQGGSVFVSSVEITVNGRTFVHEGTINPSFTLAPNVLERNVHINRDRYFGMVVKLTAGIANYTFPHEMGHLLGCSHAIGDPGPRVTPNNPGGLLREYDPELVFNPFGSYQENYPQIGGALGVPGAIHDEFLSAGNRFTAFGPNSQGVTSFHNYATIMAYTWVTQTKSQTGQAGAFMRIPRFASPRIYWGNKKTGDNHGRMLPPPHGKFIRPMYTDQVRTQVETGRVAGFFRDRTGSGRNPSRWSVPTRQPRGTPDMGSVSQRNSRANSRSAKAADPKGGGGSSGSSGGGASKRTVEPEVPMPDTDVGRAATASSDGLSRSSTGPRANPTAPGKSVPTSQDPPVKTGAGGTGAGSSVKAAGGKSDSGSTVPNDSRSRSQLLPLRLLAGRKYGATTSGHNRGATGGEDASVPVGDGRPIFHGRSVWWHIKVPADGVYNLVADTHGSGIDTTLGVWLDDAPKPLAVNDNDPRRSGAASAVRLHRVALRRGQKIVLALDGVNGSQGRLRLTVRLEPAR